MHSAMAIFSSTLFLTLFLYVPLIQCQKVYPPEIKGTFQAIGEIIASGKDNGEEDLEFFGQIAFEENYHEKNNLSSYEIREFDLVTVIYEDLTAGQTFILTQDEPCREYTAKEFQKANFLPNITPLKVKQNTIAFPLRQLFNSLSNDKLVVFNKERKYRGINARFWSYTYNNTAPEGTVTIKIDEIWSEKSWKTSSPNPQVPLAFEINQVIATHDGKQVEEIYNYVTITHFVEGMANEQSLQPPEGEFCEGRSKSRLPFPTFKNMNYISFNYEVVMPDSGSVRIGQTWFNVPEKMLRTDYLPLQEFRTETEYVSRIHSLRSGKVYEIARMDSTECKIKNLVDFEYDPQIIFNVTSAAYWKIEGLFGLQAKYFYLGETTKRGITCSRWQAKRNDWPSMDRGIKTVWEWCIVDTRVTNTKFDNSIFPVISLNIFVVESKDDEEMYPDGLQMEYHFYNFRNYSTPVINAVAFDITPCSPKNNRTHVKFSVEVPSDMESEMETIVSDVTFLEAWKIKLYEKIGSFLPPESLRLQRFKGQIEDKKLWIYFTILDPLKTDDSKDVKNGQFIMNQIEGAINSQTYKINWKSPTDSKTYIFTANKGSFSKQ